MSGEAGAEGGEIDWSRVVDTMAPALGIPLSEEIRQGVVAHLRVVAAMAELVRGLPLPDEAEPAPIFLP